MANNTKNRQQDERYKEFYRDYKGETLRDGEKTVSDDAARARATRRRIEDVREGLRLDRDVFDVLPYVE